MHDSRSVRGFFAGVLVTPAVVLGLAAMTSAYELGQEVKVGSGSTACVACGDGHIHVFAKGKYRRGPSLDALGPEETVATSSAGGLCRMTVDSRGRVHVAWSGGLDGSAETLWYAVRDAGGKWTTAEKITDETENPNGNGRTDLPVDAHGNVLVSYWALNNAGDSKTSTCNGYLWKTPDGTWGDPTFFSVGRWESTPKVQELDGIFYMIAKPSDRGWALLRPVSAGGTFSPSDRTSFGGVSGNQWSNEGADFFLFGPGHAVLTWDIRKDKETETGLGGSLLKDGKATTIYLGKTTGDGHHGGGKIHPEMALDEATGKVGMIAGTGGGGGYSLVTVDRDGTWGELHIEKDSNNTWRFGGSIADLPGSAGWVICYSRSGTIYARTMEAGATLLVPRSPAAARRSGTRPVVRLAPHATIVTVYGGSPSDLLGRRLQSLYGTAQSAASR